jgi:VanZ family protein
MRKKLFWWVLVVAWCAFIFYMSQKSAVVSAEQSSRVVAVLNRFFSALLGESYVTASSWAVRKSAHFSEYLLLGVLLFQALRSPRQPKPAIWPVFALGTFYAISDEIHQLFVSGRAMRWYDVAIDAAGVLAGVLLLTAVRAGRRE